MLSSPLYTVQLFSEGKKGAPEFLHRNFFIFLLQWVTSDADVAKKATMLELSIWFFFSCSSSRVTENIAHVVVES